MPAASLSILVSGTVAWGQDPGWPRQYTDRGNTLVVYQPQVDDWINFTELDWRMPVPLTPAGGKAVVGFGVPPDDRPDPFKRVIHDFPCRVLWEVVR